MFRSNFAILFATAAVVSAFACRLCAQEQTSPTSPERPTWATGPLPNQPTWSTGPQPNQATWSTGPQPDQLVLSNQALEEETTSILSAYRSERDSAKRDELVRELKQKLTKHFDVKQKIRENLLIDLEERVRLLRDEHDRRATARSTIIESQPIDLFETSDAEVRELQTLLQHNQALGHAAKTTGAENLPVSSSGPASQSGAVKRKALKVNVGDLLSIALHSKLVLRELVVEDPTLATATSATAKRVLLTGKSPGITKATLVDEKGIKSAYTLEVQRTP